MQAGRSGQIAPGGPVPGQGPGPPAMPPNPGNPAQAMPSAANPAARAMPEAASTPLSPEELLARRRARRTQQNQTQ